MLRRAFRKLRYAALLMRVGGPATFFHQLRRQLYSRANFIGMERNLNTKSVRVPCPLKYTLRLASRKDMEEVLQKAKSERKEPVHELIQRNLKGLVSRSLKKYLGLSFSSLPKGSIN